MNFVRTVTGDFPPESLGHCQCHEHLFIAKGKSFEVNNALWMDDLETSLREVELYKAAGGGAFVDAQPAGAGGMPDALQKVSKKTGVKIIASTGFHKLIFYDNDDGIYSDNEVILGNSFVDAIEKGMNISINGAVEETSVRAGIIKCALDACGLNEDYKRLFRAAAYAAKLTGAPMLIHTEDGACALELIAFLRESGIHPHRLLICHADRHLEHYEEKLKIARTGVYLQCDTIARSKYHNDDEEALFIKRLCDDGYEDMILIGLDTTRQRLKAYGGTTGLDYILSNFLQLLKLKGLTEAQINKICIINPSHALSFSFK